MAKMEDKKFQIGAERPIETPERGRERVLGNFERIIEKREEEETRRERIAIKGDSTLVISVRPSLITNPCANECGNWVNIFDRAE